jgi:hypothetical protein
MAAAPDGDLVARHQGVGVLVPDLEHLGDEVQDGDATVGAGRNREGRPVVHEVVGHEVANALEVAVVDGPEHGEGGLFHGHGRLFPLELGSNHLKISQMKW